MNFDWPKVGPQNQTNQNKMTLDAAHGLQGQTCTRRAVAKEGVKGGGKPRPWGSEVWKSSENGGTEEGSTRSTRRIDGFL